MTEKQSSIAADRGVDGLYLELRQRYGANDPRANGYLYPGYFYAEQRMLITLLNPQAQMRIDAACGSGLMLSGIPSRGLQIGIDFNADACRDAKQNGVIVLQGDVFRLPFPNDSIDEIVTCQFFNQQNAESVAAFIAECARVLTPGGQIVMVWRNGRALIHRFAQGCVWLINRLRSEAQFPYNNHAFDDVDRYALSNGLQVLRRLVACPPLGWSSDAVNSVLAWMIGASQWCVLHKPNTNND